MHAVLEVSEDLISAGDLSLYALCEIFRQVLAQFRFGEETTGKIFSGVGNEFRVQDLDPDASPRFSYERELQAFFDRKSSEKPRTCVIG